MYSSATCPAKCLIGWKMVHNSLVTQNCAYTVLCCCHVGVTPAVTGQALTLAGGQQPCTAWLPCQHAAACTRPGRQGLPNAAAGSFVCRSTCALQLAPAKFTIVDERQQGQAGLRNYSGLTITTCRGCKRRKSYQTCRAVDQSLLVSVKTRHIFTAVGAKWAGD